MAGPALMLPIDCKCCCQRVKETCTAEGDSYVSAKFCNQAQDTAKMRGVPS
jgi:hypothetical protein